MAESGSDVANGPETPPQFRLNILLAFIKKVLSKHFLFLAVICAINYAFVLWFIDGVFDTIENATLHQGISFAPSMFRIGLAILAGGLSSALMGLMTFQCLQDEPVRSGESLYRMISHIVPIVLTVLAMSIITMAGMILLIVPGVIALVTFSVALPACLVEKLGPFASLSRSVALTKGHRGSVFFLFVAYTVISNVFGIVVGAALAPVLRQPERGFEYFAAQSFLWVVLWGFLQLLLWGFLQLAFAVTYYILRISSEGRSANSPLLS